MHGALKRLSPEEFPLRLREIPDAPKQLYVEGALPSYDVPWLTIVGSRSCTAYGKQVCRELVSGLRGHNVVIVSGLAYGIDAEAHKAALEAGLTTVAVPGSGLNRDVLYPRAHVALADEIIKAGGALLSELDPEQGAAPWTFPKRNRVMVGLSNAVLLIEAREKSGTLITARLASEYNRDLLAVPGSIFSEESKGVHQFLKLGATPVTTTADILETLGIKTNSATHTHTHANLSQHELLVFHSLSSSPLERDALIAAIELPITEANILLSTMELKGLILEEFGVIRIRQ